MESTESFVFLTHHPMLIVEVNLNYILCVLTVISRIDVYSGLLNTDAQRDLKEMRPCIPVFLAT